jgi:S1-C subfamily serine protease
MRRADVLLLDKAHDLALLRFEGLAAPALRVRDSLDVQEGQAVGFTGFPLGNTLGFAPVTHLGMVSSIAPAALPMATAQQLSSASVRGLRQGSFEVFQIDGTAYPGNSGGPLFDVLTGEVLGVVNMVLLRTTREAPLSLPSGISYAIPSHHVLELLQAQADAPEPPALPQLPPLLPSPAAAP